MRYIIFQDFGGKHTPIIFPDRIEFVDMREQMPYTTVVSCGAVTLRGGSFECSGGDAGLGLGAGPDDADIISAAFLPAE
jgi:hypothetical protein